MRTFIKILDHLSFVLFGMAMALCVLPLIFPRVLMGRRRRGHGPVNRLSFAVCDLISNKYDSMIEDALVGQYIARDYYIYLDFINRDDRFEAIGDRIYFHSIAVHPRTGPYAAGFKMVNMLLVEVRVLFRAFGIMFRNDVAFVKSHDPHLLGLNGLVTAAAFRVPCVLHVNSDFDMKYRGTGKISSPVFMSRGIERLFESAVMGACDLIMADRDFYKKSGSLPRSALKKYASFGVRVDGAHYSAPGTRRDLSKEMGLEGARILLYVGRLHAVKYPEDALRAFFAVRRALGDVKLVMVGSGELMGRLKDMAAKEGMEEDILFLGPRKQRELADIYHTADILLAPHGGVTLLESALAATPIVAYDFDWHPEFLKDGKMGYLVPFGDFNALAERTVSLLKDDALKSRMGACCREEAMRGYQRDVSLENERRIYGQVISA